MDNLHTLLVDPPRVWLDKIFHNLARRINRVVYVSYSPVTLARDLTDLVDTHRLTHEAAFDQFPYTLHLVMGVLLEKKTKTWDVS